MTTFAELSPAQKALLLCWTPRESVYADHVDYPCDLNEEKRVMKSLAEIGLFCIDDYDDPEHGPCRRLFVTAAGRALVAQQCGTKHPSEER